VGDKYSGTNAVLVGDRIFPQNIKIRSGVIIAAYDDRRPDEPMTAPLSVAKTKYLGVKNGQLEEIKPLGRGEQALEGSVTIAHEVRSLATLSVEGRILAANGVLAAGPDFPESVGVLPRLQERKGENDSMGVDKNAPGSIGGNDFSASGE
jgi:hypothetical protein